VSGDVPRKGDLRRAGDHARGVHDYGERSAVWGAEPGVYCGRITTVDQALSGTTSVLVNRAPGVLERLATIVAELGGDVALATDDLDAALAAAARADVLVVEYGAGAAGKEHLRSSLSRTPSLVVVAVGAPGDADAAHEALAAGARAFAPVDVSAADMALAIRQAVRPTLHLATSTPPAAEEPLPDGVVLTAREHEILSLVAGGASNGEIAKQLWVTEQTVKFHLSNVYRKLGVRNRTEASRRAYLDGVLGRDAPAPNSRSAQLGQ
jgi:DNA-binding NarL/FixJ family response regulator